jgi:hypothetical protein
MGSRFRPLLAESPTYDGISAIYKASSSERIFSLAQPNALQGEGYEEVRH